MDRFKERLIEKLKNDVFDKIIDKILGPQKKDDSGENSDTDKKSLTVIQEEIVAVTAVKAVSARALKIKNL